MVLNTLTTTAFGCALAIHLTFVLLSSTYVAADEVRAKRFAVDPVGNYLLKRPHAGNAESLEEAANDQAIPLDFISSEEEQMHKRLLDPVGSYLLRKRYIDPVGSYLLAKKSGLHEDAKEKVDASMADRIHHTFHGNPARP